ncbi:MAG: DUF1648 domain-containing protein [Sphingobacteriales bacterium]|nr:MAG: DUF1648 domain-containing protein [Sphingobacteriales bacterium]
MMKRGQQILGWLSGGLLLFCWLMIFRSFGALPATVPIHFDATGRPDNWAPKAGIWVLPFIATVIYGLFTFLYRYAHVFPRKQGFGDPEANLQLLRSFFLQLRFAMMLVMVVGILFSVQAALGKTNAEPGIMVPFIILVAFAPTALFLFRMLRTKPVR